MPLATIKHALHKTTRWPARRSNRRWGRANAEEPRLWMLSGRLELCYAQAWTKSCFRFDIIFCFLALNYLLVWFLLFICAGLGEVVAAGGESPVLAWLFVSFPGHSCKWALRLLLLNLFSLTSANQKQIARDNLTKEHCAEVWNSTEEMSALYVARTVFAITYDSIRVSTILY